MRASKKRGWGRHPEAAGLGRSGAGLVVGSWPDNRVLGLLEILKEEAGNSADKVDAPYASRISKSSAHSRVYLPGVGQSLYLLLDCTIPSVHLGAKGTAFLLRTGFRAWLPSSAPTREKKRQGRLEKNSKKRAFLENHPFLTANGLS